MTTPGYTYATPHSRNAWANLPEAKRGFKSYDRYLNWWKGSVAPKFTVSADPFAPMPIGAQRAMITQGVNSLINPLIKQFEESITRRSKEGGRAIGAATDAFVKGVSPLADNLGAVHDTSIEGVKGANATLSQFIKDTGGSVASTLGAMIPEQDAGGAMSAAQKFGTGLSGQHLAQGQSTISRMYADRAADVSYGEKMPGYARAFGTEAVGDFERQLNLQRDEGLGEIRAQVPGLISQLTNSLADRELSKAIAAKGFEFDQKKLDAPGAPPKINTAASSAYGFQIDTTGNPIVGPDGKPIPYPKKPTSTKINEAGLTNARLSAKDLHTEMMKRFNDPGQPLTKAQKQQILLSNRDKVRLQVISDLETYYPNQPAEWIYQQAAQILSATGWPNVGKALLKEKFGIDVAPSTATPAGAGPTVQPKPKQTPAAPPAAPTDRGQDNPNPDRASESTSKNQIARERAAKEQSAYENATNGLRSYAESYPGTFTRAQAKKLVITNIQKQLRGWPYKKIIALANQAVAEVYKNTLHGPTAGR